MQRNKKICPIHRGERSIETVPEEAEMLDLLEKAFKSAFKICSKNERKPLLNIKGLKEKLEVMSARW